MKKIFYLTIFAAAVTGLYFTVHPGGNTSDKPELKTETLIDPVSFTFKKGDILVRPNREGLPGSCAIRNGRRYGHVALVINGATGATIEEALSKTTVIEALFFDQSTRKFQFNKKNQIREAYAITSFGTRFKGIRYRLRMDLSDDQIEKMTGFVKNQLDGGYNILSMKKGFENESDRKNALKSLRNSSWHCATLIWEALYLSTGIDIDGNGGILIYPADIIASSCFDLNGGRVCF